MKKTIIFLGLILVANALFATITVDGYCYLDGETNHLDTKVLFEAVTPSAITDSTYTNIDGSFLIELSSGVYTVTYSHEDRLSYTIQGDIPIFNDTTLDHVTLYYGLSGSLSGRLYSGHNYHVISLISISSADTLIIEPGTTITFMGHYELIVYGTLLSEGTETDSIVFTSGFIPQNANDWDRIQFNGSASSNSKISYSRISYAYYGIDCLSNSSTQISNNNIFNNYASGIFIAGFCSPTIVNNKICDNGGSGINCRDHSSPIISNNSITNNQDRGITCAQSSSPIVHYNIINDNYTDGIGCFSSSIVLSNNTICNNNNIGTYCDYSTFELNNNIISNNDIGIYVSVNSYPSIEHNLFWDNNSISYSNLPAYFGQIVTQNANGDSCDTYYNLFIDPLLVDPDNQDYHLIENSPCIDAGDPASPLDPDGTIADIGAYYFDQSTIIYPPIADFSSNIAEGYPPLTVVFNDLSIQGTGIITNWEWSLEDGDSSFVQNPTHIYQMAGTYDVSLTVKDENDSTDTETKIDYITIFVVPPAPPTDVQIEIYGNDVILNWSVVDTTIFGTPIDVDYYIIYQSDESNGNWQFSGATSDTTYTHNYVAGFIDKMFYRVEAFVGTRQELEEYVERWLRNPEDNFLNNE